MGTVKQRRDTPARRTHSSSAKSACKIIACLLKPTIKKRPKDAAFVMLPARVIDSIYAHANKGAR